MAGGIECGTSVLLLGLLMVFVSGEKAEVRHKRSLIMPGTLWCGAGSSTDNFTNLGIFNGADFCCREHDQCSHQIEAFQFQYGIRNFRLHTISHCDCDTRFRLCLLDLNDTVPTLVGIMFFNVLEMPCFSLRKEEQCVEWHWWGGCKKYDFVPKAELHKQPFFNYSHSEDPHPSRASINTTVARANYGAKRRQKNLKKTLKKRLHHHLKNKSHMKLLEGDIRELSEGQNEKLSNRTNLVTKGKNLLKLGQKNSKKWREKNSLQLTVGNVKEETIRHTDVKTTLDLQAKKKSAKSVLGLRKRHKQKVM